MTGRQQWNICQHGRKTWNHFQRIIGKYRGNNGIGRCHGRDDVFTIWPTLCLSICSSVDLSIHLSSSISHCSPPFPHPSTPKKSRNDTHTRSSPTHCLFLLSLYKENHRWCRKLALIKTGPNISHTPTESLPHRKCYIPAQQDYPQSHWQIIDPSSSDTFSQCSSHSSPSSSEEMPTPPADLAQLQWFVHRSVRFSPAGSLMIQLLFPSTQVVFSCSWSRTLVYPSQIHVRKDYRLFLHRARNRSWRMCCDQVRIAASVVLSDVEPATAEAFQGVPVNVAPISSLFFLLKL